MPTSTAKRGRPVGSNRRRVSVTFRSTGETMVFPTYDEAGARLGISGETLRVYLAHTKGRIDRKVWSDELGDFDLAAVRRIGVDPLTSSR